jgi:tRNA (adenine-N(1)-)-methyltransferase non-catalytic subunit
MTSRRWRSEGLHGQAIVHRLVSSTSFAEKTELSQQKYLKKKEQKNCEYVLLWRPTARLLVDCMYREDTLAQMLLLSGGR